MPSDMIYIRYNCTYIHLRLLSIYLEDSRRYGERLEYCQYNTPHVINSGMEAFVGGWRIEQNISKARQVLTPAKAWHCQCGTFERCIN